VDLRLFRKARFTWSTFAFVVVGFVISGVLFAISPYVQIVQGNDVMQTGIRVLPMIAALIAGSVAGNRLTERLGSNVVIAGGLLVTAAGMVLLSRAGAETGYGLIAAALSVGGSGLGWPCRRRSTPCLARCPEPRPGRNGPGRDTPPARSRLRHRDLGEHSERYLPG